MKTILSLLCVVLMLINFIVLDYYNKYIDNTRIAVLHLAFNSYMVGCKVEGGVDCDRKAGEYVRPIKEMNGN